MLKGFVKSDRQLVCPLPVQNNSQSQWSMNVNGFVSNVSISANCIDYTATGLTVQRVYQPSIIHASPTVGSSRGGARVLLTGKNHPHLNLLMTSCSMITTLVAPYYTFAHCHLSP